LHPYNALTRAVMKAGATYVLIPEFTGEEFLRCCESYPISFLGATPGMFEQCLLASRKSGIVPKSLRACFAVGGTLDPALWREFEERFETRIFGGMGCKELGIFSLEPADRPSRHGSIGQVLPYMEARIASAESPLGDSRQRGFLWVKSESIITHYWIDGKPSPLRSEQGWFPTGYEVHRDNEDYLYCTGATLDQSISGQKRYFNIG
jgi:acyl-CoA synthetase (AMP-forming)/AMP-acid ligase II